MKSFSDMLSGEGYEIVSALDGETGLRMAREMVPDLILLDLILPKKHGFEVLKELKEDDKTKNLPVIILTNLGQAEDVEQALSLGATTYLVKSNYTLEEVLEMVEKVME
jgi:DNA-binding response OmpR family regulator